MNRAIKTNGPEVDGSGTSYRLTSAWGGCYLFYDLDYSTKTDSTTVNPASVTRGVGNDSRS